jgi:tetratricopeptide (TPR) repeat protein
LKKKTRQKPPTILRKPLTVTTLSPDFYLAYSMGGVALSVLVSDVEGAAKIYAKGVARFPDKWQLCFRAGVHAIIEEKNQAKAADYLEKAAKNGAPDWVYSLSAKMYDEAGRRDIALSLLKELESTPDTDPKIIAHMKERLGVK